MLTFLLTWRKILAYMTLFPFPKSHMPSQVAHQEYNRKVHLEVWWFGWIHVISGIIGVGFYAPYLIQEYILRTWPIFSEYEEYLIIILVLMGGFLWQGFSILTQTILVSTEVLLRASAWLSSIAKKHEDLAALHRLAAKASRENSPTYPQIVASIRIRRTLGFGDGIYALFWVILGILLSIATYLGPSVLTIWVIYWYITHFAPNHNLVGIGIIGATSLKLLIAFLPGIIKSIFTGALFAWLLRVIRGESEPPEPRKPVS